MNLLHFVSIAVRLCFFTSLSKWENDELNLLLIMTNKILYDLSSRFHVAVHLFSYRSQKKSKRGKNISDTLGCNALCATFL